MKALTFVKPNEAAVLETAAPSISPDELLVEMKSVGICHSDFELFAGKYIIPVSFPTIPGHEWSGEVLEVGSKVTDYKPGDRVVGECVINRGIDHFGFSVSGAMAEVFKVKPEWLHSLPEELSHTQGALVEPFSCAYYAAVVAGNVNASDTVVVFGAGPIGQCCVAAVSAMGAYTIAIDPASERLETAKKMGAHETLDPTKTDVKEQLQRITRGRGASVVMEASGNPHAMAEALEVAGQEARVVYIGINIGNKVPAALGLIQSKALRIRGTIGSPGVWQDTLRFLAQSGLDLSPMVTSRFSLDEATTAFEAARNTKTNIKVHIEH